MINFVNSELFLLQLFVCWWNLDQSESPANIQKKCLIIVNLATPTPIYHYEMMSKS